ncbi:MAG TPA: hypothetical protein VFE10_03350 [Phenylobacterium sp.]|jgi:hypothetical protein|nr:hypothetical protein [Phenylobacterium sp.]
MRSQKTPTSPPLSRRTVLAAPAGFAAGAAGASQPQCADDAERLCRLWLAAERERDRLLLRWGDIEGDLIKRCHWCSLSEAEQETSPLGAPLRAIDKRLDVLFDEREAIARRLPLVTATSPGGVFLKLDVVRRELQGEDFPMIHRLLTSAVRDLRSLWR